MRDRVRSATSSGWPLTDRSAPGARPFLGELTGLRFLAAFWVLGFHTLPREDHSPAFWRSFWGAGYTGVTLFFVLSGFVLVYTYGPVGPGHIHIRSFLSARVARLFPVYLAALVIALPEFVHTALPRAGSPGLAAGDSAVIVATTPRMLQAWLPRIGCSWNCPGWSLSAEALFYLLFPLFALLLYWRRPRTLLLSAIGAFALALVCAELRAIPALDSFGFVGRLVQSPITPLFRLPEFLLGIAIGRWYLDRRLSGVPLYPARGLAVVIAAAATLAVVAAASTPVPASPLTGVWLLPLFAALILGLAERGNRGILARPVAMMLGEASYALYLIHGPVHVYVLGAARRVSPDSLTAHPWEVFGAYVGIVLGASVLLYRFLERPARHALRRRFARQVTVA